MSDQEEQDISQIIDEGLEAIQSGRMSLEDVLKQHPDQAELIRSELELSMWLVSRQNEVAPRAGFVHASRKRVVERIQQEASQRGTKHMLFGFLWPPRFAFRTATVIAVIFVLFIASGGVVSASLNTVPGDGLYSVKRFTEQVTYQVTADPVQRVNLSVQYAGRRLNEAQAMISKGDPARADVALSEYNQQVKQASVALEQIPASQSKQKSDMATLVQSSLTAHQDQLADLKQNSPSASATALDQALEITSSSISNAATVFNVVNKITPTPTPTVTSSPTLEYTPTVPPTFTAVPSDTPVGKPTSTTPTVEGTPSPAATYSLGAKEVKPSPTPTRKPSKTPKSDSGNPGNPGNKPEEPPGKKDPPNPPKDNSHK